ncbi:putative terpenoid cyclases/protein prenyltransferase alpha-alpha toroid [Helianthus annuus]|uniref:Terpenoid cyclases/protein prenyltransferase alpha-alpha toroid n=1 Tax=Helianthus annuus TaxID=4232 RepID=A0A9K3HDM1_HELAN|nr:putative terpenoid cyclases/protein prenyltransferase alpha-alpha toroid [Helianthus annuus]KAJ0861401.1 Alpha-copaene synthase [Helianthus annuus]
MATTEANTMAQANSQTTIEPVRHLANFPPSIWGDQFLSFSLDNSQLEAYSKAMEQPKENVRRMILNPAIDTNEKLGLIYCVYRLGLTYNFSKDIDGQLDELFKQLNLQSYNEADLYTISIHFQVFRHFGYRFSCDVFNKFKDSSSGKFKEDMTRDVRGMISLYESAQLRIRGESILDEAGAFAESKLKTIEKTLDGTLAQQVKHVLERPFNRGHQMVEARKWWKDLDLPAKTLYVRDRVPELYVWILAFFLEPYYSEVRIITTKIVLLVLVLDDTYDAYATIEESRLLTHAINRWEVSAMLQLPEYMKPLYEILLNEYDGFYKHGRTNVIETSKKAFQDLARSYHQESEWRHAKEVPSFEEYMKIGTTTSAHNVLSKTALIGMGNIVTREALAWYESYPKIVQLSELIGRLEDDVVSVEFERERAPTATSVDAYMKTYGVSENVAVKILKKLVENGWKDLNEACLKPTEVSLDLLAPIIGLTNMTDVAYRHNDGLTFPEKTLKEYITLLFCVPVPM